MTAQKERATPDGVEKNIEKSICYNSVTIFEAETVVAYRYQSPGYDLKNGSTAESGLAYSSREFSVSSLADIQRVFTELHENPCAIAVMGRAPADNVKLSDQFEDRLSRVAFFDVGVSGKMGGIEQAISAMRQTLPKQFHNLDCIWSIVPQKEPTNFERAYLAFWMSEPMTLQELAALVKRERCARYQENRLPAPQRILQLARPVFAEGVADPLEARQGFCEAAGYVPVEVAIVPDKITILETLGPKLTKTYTSNGGTIPYEDAASFKVKEVEVSSLRDVRDHLGRMHKTLQRCLIRGKFIGEEQAAKGNKPGTWLRNNANFDDQPLHWFMLDIDGYVPGFASPVNEPELAVQDFLYEMMPPCFQAASFYWHLSSSAGMPGKEKFLKAHVHFWSKTPYTTAQMHAWAKVIGPAIDSAVFRRVQVHYTADPVFREGRIDPISVRAGWHQGVTDYVDLVIDQATLDKARDQGSGEGGSDMVLKDPSEKDGLIGAFHKTFTAEDVLLNFLEGEFEQATERRYTWHDGGGTPEGVWVHDDGNHIGSSHNTWPIDGIANLWDVVRVFKFGDLDTSEAEETFETLGDTRVGSRPSDLAMKAWAAELPEVKAEIANEQAEQAASVSALLEKIAAAKSVPELTGQIAAEAREVLAGQNDQITKARIDGAIQATAKKLDGSKLPIAAVRALTQTAPIAKKGSMVVDAGDQLGMARALKNKVFRDHLRRRVAVRANSTWYVFNGQYYKELQSDEKINNEAWQFLPNLMCRDEEGELFPLFPTKGLVAGVVDALRSELATDIELPPAWLPGSEGPSPANLLVMGNGILDIATGKMLEHTPHLFAVNALPYDYDPAAGCPQWLAFLQQVLPGDVESHQLLQEWFGYCLTADTSQQKFLMLIGQKRSGKGTVGRILQQVLGSINTIGPTLASLSKDFGLEHWIGKLAAVFGDTRSGGKEPQTVVERILSIVGEDTLSVGRKHRADVTTRLPTRILILSNELLRLGDASGALIGRMLVLEFGQTFYGREDTTLEAKLLHELPGILNWALAGKRRLAERGRFEQPATGQELLQDSHDANSPITVFVREHCEIDPMYEEKQDLVFEAWQIHCREENHRSGDKAQFAKNMKAAFPEFKIYRPREGADQPRTYQGLKLTEKMLDQVALYRHFG